MKILMRVMGRYIKWIRTKVEADSCQLKPTFVLKNSAGNIDRVATPEHGTIIQGNYCTIGRVV